MHGPQHVYAHVNVMRVSSVAWDLMQRPFCIWKCGKIVRDVHGGEAGALARALYAHERAAALRRFHVSGFEAFALSKCVACCECVCGRG